MSDHQFTDAAAHDKATAGQQPEALTQDELERQIPELLPDRKAMSLIAPGATTGTPAAALLPDEAMQWHGPPGEPHIM